MTKAKDEETIEEAAHAAALPEEKTEAESVPPKIATLFERILWVRKRVTRLGKDSTVSTGGSGSYKAVSHDKVTAFIRPKMNQAGIVSWVNCIEATNAETGATTNKGRKIVQFRGRFAVTFANVHNKEDQLHIEQHAYADDYGDKAPGKATSYAMKYAMLKMFMIETGEEDEERVAPDGGKQAVLNDDQVMMLELYAVAEECFGDNAPAMLLAMSKRRVFVEYYGLSPQDRMADAVRSLRVKKQSEDVANAD